MVEVGFCLQGSQGPYSLYQDQAANSLMKKVRCGYSVCDTDLQPMEAWANEECRSALQVEESRPCFPDIG